MKQVTQDEWSDYLADFRTVGSEFGREWLLCKGSRTGILIGAVEYSGPRVVAHYINTLAHKLCTSDYTDVFIRSKQRGT